jgi:hypothetical protein
MVLSHQLTALHELDGDLFFWIYWYIPFHYQHILFVTFT